MKLNIYFIYSILDRYIHGEVRIMVIIQLVKDYGEGL